MKMNRFFYLTVIAILILSCTKKNESQKASDYNRVGRGIAPPPSHTTVHAFAHGGFLKLINLL
jgi:hypothetical protein